MTPAGWGSGAILLSIGLMPGRVAGQEAGGFPRDSGVTLEPIEVHSIAPAAHPAVGSGLPARLSVFSRQAIDAWRPRLAADILATGAGISVYDDLGTPYKLNLSTRGFNAGPTVGLPSGVTVFLDGVRQNEPDAAQVNFDLLPMEQIERIELLSGAGTLLGPNSLGGAVNLVTRRGRGPAHGAVEVEGGSFEAFSVGLEAGGERKGWDYFAGGGVESEAGWRDATGADRLSLFGSAGWSGTGRGLRVHALAARSRAETAGSLPESIFGSSPTTNFTAGDFEDLNAQQVAVSGFTAAGASRISFTVHVRRSDAERYNVNQAPDDNVRSRSRSYAAGATADWRTSRALGGGIIAVRIGADVMLHRTRIRLFEEDFEDPEDQTLTTEVESPGSDLAGFLLADYRIRRFTLSAGVRGDRVIIPFRDILDPAADTTSTFTRLSPRAGVSLDAGSGALLYASAGQAFRAPVVLELACADPEAACPLPFALGDDPPLDPVIATTLETGARVPLGPMVFTVAAYRTAVENEIVFVASDVARLAGYFTNLDRTRREGVEAGGVAALLPWLSTYANYAYTRATYQTAAQLFSIRVEDEFEGHPLAGENEIEPGDRLPLVPGHQVRFGAQASLPAGLDAAADASWTGRQWLRGDEANETSPLDDYFALNARIGWKTGAWEIGAIVRNVLGSRAPIFGTFNENRRTGDLERFLTPMQARSVRVSIRRIFGG